MSSLWVAFIDEGHDLEPGSELSFGRNADIVIDDANQFMHRIVGSFVWHRDSWWVRNSSRHAEIELLAETGKRVTIPAGSSELLDGPGVIRFDAGASSYELEYALDTEISLPTVELPRDEDDSYLTRDFGRIPLNEEQRAMLTELCRIRLTDPSATAADIPPNAEIANRLGWSLRKFDRKLDYICRRLAEEGVRGVRGVKGVEATDRRAVLVEHMITSGQITVADIQ